MSSWQRLQNNPRSSHPRTGNAQSPYTRPAKHRGRPRPSSTPSPDRRDQPGELPNASRATRQPGDDFFIFSKPRKASRTLLDPQTAPALTSQDVQGPRANSVLLAASTSTLAYRATRPTRIRRDPARKARSKSCSSPPLSSIGGSDLCLRRRRWRPSRKRPPGTPRPERRSSRPSARSVTPSTRALATSKVSH
jgi:hypothetical protein